jgi:hypothetical protein
MLKMCVSVTETNVAIVEDIGQKQMELQDNDMQLFIPVRCESGNA